MLVGEMKKQKLFNNKSGVAGVIEALLLVGLVAVILSIIQLSYIPQIMVQREAEHMDEVSNQFSYLKSMIDIQTITQSSAPMFSMITLGSRELPYFVTARALGQLNIIEDEDSKITWSGESYSIPLTSIKYDADNSYYVDQTYVLEGGGIIVKQPTGNSSMRVDPPIDIKTQTGKIILYFNITRFVGKEYKNSTGGYGKCIIRTNYSHTDPYTGNPFPIQGAASIKIYSDYPHAWNESLNNSIGNLVDVKLDPSETPKYVEIKQKSGGDPIDLYVTEIYIDAQLGPGWV
jgi:hypothetical protein